MATLTYHRKPNGTTYVYRQESHWDKSKRRTTTTQVCLGKLNQHKEIIYNKRFSDPVAREALDKGELVSESLITGQSLVLSSATQSCGLYQVMRQVLSAEKADFLLSLAWAVCALDGKMYHASTWIEQNDCPANKLAPRSQDISRALAGISQDDVDSFQRAWITHRSKGLSEHYCFDITSVSSRNARNPFVEWGHNRDKEAIPQINLALLTSVATRIPVYYEVLPGSMSDVKAMTSFLKRMEKYSIGRIRMLLDRGFYSASNIDELLAGHVGFYIPVPANVKVYQELIDLNRDNLEMPENIISVTEDNKDAVYGMTMLGKISGKRVWQHIYYDTARRTEHILSFFAKLSMWEQELLSGNTSEANTWAYERYFTVKETPKRGRQVKRRQEEINKYKQDRAGYWVILTNCEKDASRALTAYRERSLVENQFDDLKNELDMHRIRTHNSETMRGRLLVQFLALVICSVIRQGLDVAWNDRNNPGDDRFTRRYSLSETMLRLGSYRKTRISGRYGTVVSTPTKTQREIFKAFGITTQST